MKVTLEMINPQLRELLAPMVGNKGMSVDELRALGAATCAVLQESAIPNAAYRVERIARTDGTEMEVCIYEPLDLARPTTGLLWLHGGGFAIQSPHISEAHFELLMNASPCVIVAPAYTLSIEKPYPAAFEDCYLALTWMVENASRLGIERDQIFVGGDSAGGNLACALTLAARDRGDVGIAFQMPIYPMLDDAMGTESMKGNDAPMWCEASNRNAWGMYLGESFGTDDVEKYAAPYRETDYRGLPPAYSFVGSIDPFCDEAVEYFARLRRAGVAAECDVYEGCPHAFPGMKSEIAEEAKQRFAAAFKEAVSRYRVEN